jgi:hypothetical protein
VLSGVGSYVRCGKDARATVSAGVGQAGLAAKIRPITQQSTAVLSLRLKPRHPPATFIKKTGHSRNLGDRCRVSQSTPVFPEAKTKLPTIYA